MEHKSLRLNSQFHVPLADFDTPWPLWDYLNLRKICIIRLRASVIRLNLYSSIWALAHLNSIVGRFRQITRLFLGVNKKYMMLIFIHCRALNIDKIIW